MKFSEMINFGVTFQKITNRGTKVIRSKLTSPNWTSSEFREYQNKLLFSVSPNFVIHIGRGIRTTTVGNLTIPKSRPSTEGMIRVTNRGTSSRINKNKGIK